MEIGFEQFVTKVLNKYGSKDFKVRNSWGIRDAYNHIRKKHWYDIGRPLKHEEFYHIVREVNKLLAENIVNGETVRFPAKMGMLEIRKRAVGARLKNGKLKVTYPVDWSKTLKLWHDDEEAYKTRILLRDEQPFVYSVVYSKRRATYGNKIFYQFVLNRFIKRALKENIRKGKIDTIW